MCGASVSGQLRWFGEEPIESVRLNGRKETLDIVCMVQYSPEGGGFTLNTSVSSPSLKEELNRSLFSVTLCGSTWSDLSAVFETVWDFHSGGQVRLFASDETQREIDVRTWDKSHTRSKTMPLHDLTAFHEGEHTSAAALFGIDIGPWVRTVQVGKITLVVKLLRTSYVANSIMAACLRDVAPIEEVCLSFLLDHEAYPIAGEGEYRVVQRLVYPDLEYFGCLI